MTDLAPPAAITRTPYPGDRWKRQFFKSCLQDIAGSTLDNCDKNAGMVANLCAQGVADNWFTQVEVDDLIAEGRRLCLMARKRKRKPRPSMKPEAEFVAEDGTVTVKKNVVLVPGTHVTSDGDQVEVGVSGFSDAVLRQLPEDLLYSRGGAAGLIRAGTFAPLNATQMRHVTDSHVRLARWARDKEQQSQFLAFEHCTPDYGTLVHAVAGSHPRCRPVRMITPYPMLTGHGVSPPGYSEGIYYCGEAIKPSDEDPTPLLDDITVDFPWADRASRHNFYVMLATPLMRMLIDGPVPMHMLMASVERTGKTKLVDDVFGRLILGRAFPATPLPEKEEEREKTLFSLLLSCSIAAHLDNINDFIDSAAICSFITSRAKAGRLFFKQEMAEVPNDLLLIGTANNPRGTGEIVKRCVPIRLQPTREDPENRLDFVHSNLAAYVAAQRPRVLSALLGLCLRSKPARCAFGGFESWASVMAGVAAEARWDGWLTNRNAWSEQADDEKRELRAFVALWRAKIGITSVPISMLLPIAREANAFGRVFSKPTDRAQAVAFGWALGKHVNRPVGAYVIRRNVSGNNAMYYLQDPGDPADIP